MDTISLFANFKGLLSRQCWRMKVEAMVVAWKYFKYNCFKMILVMIDWTTDCVLYRTETYSRTKRYKRLQLWLQRHNSFDRCLRCRCFRVCCCSCYRCRLRHRIQKVNLGNIQITIYLNMYLLWENKPQIW